LAEKLNEWYTSAIYIEAARSVMGGIDLDPASCEMANRTVRATRHYTKEQNGLMLPWGGNVWLNPPFGITNKANISLQQRFSEKVVAEYRAGNIRQAIVLCIGNTCTKRFQPFWDYLLCFADHQPIFIRPNGDKQKIGFGVCFVYLGPNEDKFVSVFSRFGRIVKAIDNPQPKPMMRELWGCGASDE
jgi:hypothetical protein